MIIINSDKVIIICSDKVIIICSDEVIIICSDEVNVICYSLFYPLITLTKVGKVPTPPNNYLVHSLANQVGRSRSKLAFMKKDDYNHFTFAMTLSIWLHCVNNSWLRQLVGLMAGIFKAALAWSACCQYLGFPRDPCIAKLLLLGREGLADVLVDT